MVTEVGPGEQTDTRGDLAERRGGRKGRAGEHGDALQSLGPPSCPRRTSAGTPTAGLSRPEPA